MSMRDRSRFIIFQVLPAFTVAVAFAGANMYPYHDIRPEGESCQCLGFPIAYSFKCQMIQGEAAFWEDFDEQGVIANIGVGISLVLGILIVSFVARRRVPMVSGRS